MENILALIDHQGQTIRQLSEQIVELVAKDVFEDDELDAAIVTIAELKAIVTEREATIRERDVRIEELEAEISSRDFLDHILQSPLSASLRETLKVAEEL